MGCRHEHQETNGWVVTALSKIIARLGRFPDSVLNHTATYLVNPNPDIQQVSGWVLVCLCCKGVCGYLMGQVRKCIVPFLLLSHPPFLSLSSVPLIHPSLLLIGPSPPYHRPFPSLSPALPLPLIGPSSPSHQSLSSTLLSFSSALPLPITGPSPPSHRPFPSLSLALPLPLIGPSPPSHRPFPSLSLPLPLPLIGASPLISSAPPLPFLPSLLSAA